MWLLHTTRLTLHEFYGRKIPHYAILSHTWSGEEVSFADLLRDPHFLAAPAQDDDQACSTSAKAQSKSKIRSFCRKARDFGLEYGWVDTCCIDKSSSAELSEAINSMFRWYRNAEYCFVHLEDVDWRGLAATTGWSQEDRAAFMQSRWFTRGWTLQELIAPRRLFFCDQTWGVTHDRLTMAAEVLEATGIPSEAIADPHKYSAAEKMFWASKRQTTREEDIAYCLLGLFNVNMPLLYGEGQAKAFYRLQVEIMRDSPDESIFAWEPSNRFMESGLLAESPANFKDSAGIRCTPYLWRRPYNMTHLGVQIDLDLHKVDRYLDSIADIRSLFWGKQQLQAAAIRATRNEKNLLVIILRATGHKSYSRIGPLIESKKLQLGPMQEYYIHS